MRVLKFGGSSVASPDRIRRVTDVLATARQDGPTVAVVSALGGVTDALLAAAATAEARGDWNAAWRKLRERHLAPAADLAPHEPELTDHAPSLFPIRPPRPKDSV